MVRIPVKIATSLECSQVFEDGIQRSEVEVAGDLLHARREALPVDKFRNEIEYLLLPPCELHWFHLSFTYWIIGGRKVKGKKFISGVSAWHICIEVNLCGRTGISDTLGKVIAG
jgi:hypothetical protein